MMLANGCPHKRKTGSLKGTITYSDNNEPVPMGTIMFSNGSYSARGNIQSDGTYTVSSLGGDDGLLPGTYEVTVSAIDYGAPADVKTDARGMPISNEKRLIDTKYGNRQASGLTAVVGRSTKKLDFSLDRAPQ